MATRKPGKVVKAALEKAADKVTELVNPPVPGVPNSEPPSLEEPTDPPEERRREVRRPERRRRGA